MHIRLAVDPEIVRAGTIKITKMRVVENTGEYRQCKRVGRPDATTHFVEARFELGENSAATLHRGDPVIVVGDEHSSSWGDEDSKHYGRVVEARAVGVALNRAAAQVRRTAKPDEVI